MNVNVNTFFQMFSDQPNEVPEEVNNSNPAVTSTSISSPTGQAIKEKRKPFFKRVLQSFISVIIII